MDDKVNSAVVVRELYPEGNVGIWRKRKCPIVDTARERVFALDASGKVLPLADEKARNAAVKSGNRLFAVSKRQIPFSCLVADVCNEAGYSWNYALEGVIEVADASQFILGWALSEATCGIDGLTTQALVSQIAADIGVLVRDRIAAVRGDGRYSVRDIEEKDVLPMAFWNDLFSSAGQDSLKGLSLRVTSRQFLCPSSLVDEKRRQAQQAEAELAERRRKEFEAVKNGKVAEAELDELTHQRELAQLQFELERTKLEEAVKRQKIDTAIYQLNQLQEAKAKFQKGGATSALVEVSKQVAALEAQLRDSGLSPQSVQEWKPVEAIDPTVTPRFQGMSDAFHETLSKLSDQANDAITLSWEYVHEDADGVASRDLVPVCSRSKSAAEPGVLHIGDRLKFRLRSERSGYLTLFNFGTSGTISKLYPNREYGTSENHIVAGRVYTLPGELLPAEVLGGCWNECGPATAETGNLERILAILTDEPLALDESSFGVEACQTFARGGFDAVEETVSSILDLKSGTWCFGLVEAQVE